MIFYSNNVVILRPIHDSSRYLINEGIIQGATGLFMICFPEGNALDFVIKVIVAVAIDYFSIKT